MEKAKSFCYGVVWFIVLIVFAWWAGLFSGILHCLISPCAACCGCAKRAMECLSKGTKLPYLIAMFMVEGKSFKKAVITCYYNYYEYLIGVREKDSIVT